MVRAAAIAATNCTPPWRRSAKPVEFWFTCARKVAGSVSRLRFMLISYRNEGLDTVEANAKLGFASDLRDYGIGAQILYDLGVRKFRFLTNNPKKVVGLEGYGIQMVEQVPIRAQPNPHNARYLETKREKMGHLL